MIASALTSDLGRAIAVVGALVVAFTALVQSSKAGSNEWLFLDIAAATFCFLAWACRK